MNKNTQEGIGKKGYIIFIEDDIEEPILMKMRALRNIDKRKIKWADIFEEEKKLSWTEIEADNKKEKAYLVIVRDTLPTHDLTSYHVFLNKEKALYYIGQPEIRKYQTALLELDIT